VFSIDGVDMFGKIERQIGAPFDLERCDPPYIARKEVRWEVVNNSDYDLEFESITLGVCYEE
jgi:hypothetical protein